MINEAILQTRGSEVPNDLCKDLYIDLAQTAAQPQAGFREKRCANVFLSHIHVRAKISL